MSFSSQVKSELAAVENTPCCAHAQAYGLLLFSRAFSFAEISMQTDMQQIAHLYHEGLLAQTGVDAQLTQSASGKYKVSDWVIHFQRLTPNHIKLLELGYHDPMKLPQNFE